ncbi:MAG TPA: hypothetical protein VKA46_17430 [Gemmataceae bacterium]|nr:hypothetical protein [Gemmataceae bacterium]
MSLPFDATLKDLGRDGPADFLTTFDQPPAGAVALLNVDLSTVTTAADLVLGVGDPLAEVMHLDFQSSAAAWKHADVLVYNALLYADYHVPVHSIVILLRPQAAHSNLNGAVSYAARPGRGSMNFGYEVVRLWEWPADKLLAGPLGTTPLAMLAALPQGVPAEDALVAVAQRLIERIDRDAPQDQGRKLLTAAFVLTGLRVSRTIARQVFRGVRKMRDSDTYMAIIDEGREEEARSVVLRLGQKRFGAPGESISAKLTAITDLERLHRLEERMFDATDWQDLLSTP